MKKMFGLFLVALAILVSGLTVSVVKAQALPNISIGEAEVVQRDGQCFVSFGFEIQNPDLVEENIIVHLYSDGQFDHSTNIGRYQVSPAEFLLVLGCPELGVEVVSDPDNLIVESNENDNSTYLDLVVTATPTATSTEVISVPTATATPTPTATMVPVDCLAIWQNDLEEVTISWSCMSEYHLYLDGKFQGSFVGDSVLVKKDEFNSSLEVAVDPNGLNLKVFLTWEELFAPEPTQTALPTTTTTPEPTNTFEATPEPTKIVVPTTTPTPVDSLPLVIVTGTSISVQEISQPWKMHLYWWESGTDFPIFDWAESPTSFDVPITSGVVEILILNGDDVVSKQEIMIRGKQILYIRDFLPVVTR